MPQRGRQVQPSIRRLGPKSYRTEEHGDPARLHESRSIAQPGIFFADASADFAAARQRSNNASTRAAYGASDAPEPLEMDKWIQGFLKQFGSLGVGLLMLVENVFPPIPSEVVMPWAGYAASRGDITFLGAIVAGSVGSFLGALLWYLLARRIGKERLARWIDRHGAWLTLSCKDIDRTDEWFQRWGGWAVLVCRMIPGLRTVISIPAGFAGMPMVRFSIFTAIGTVMWTTLLAGLGWWLGKNYSQLAGVLSWVSTAVVGGLALWWLWRLIAQAAARRDTT